MEGNDLLKDADYVWMLIRPISDRQQKELEEVGFKLARAMADYINKDFKMFRSYTSGAYVEIDKRYFRFKFVIVPVPTNKLFIFKQRQVNEMLEKQFNREIKREAGKKYTDPTWEGGWLDMLN